MYISKILVILFSVLITKNIFSTENISSDIFTIEITSFLNDKKDVRSVKNISKFMWKQNIN